MNETRTKSVLTSVLATACLALLVGCSTPSAPNQTEEPDDGEPEDGETTSLLVPAPDRPAPDLLLAGHGRHLG